jgi:ribosomal protein L4
MDIDVVDSSNKKVGTLALSDELFGKRVKTDLIWEGVVHE